MESFLPSASFRYQPFSVASTVQTMAASGFLMQLFSGVTATPAR